MGAWAECCMCTGTRARIHICTSRNLLIGSLFVLCLGGTLTFLNWNLLEVLYWPFHFIWDFFPSHSNFLIKTCGVVSHKIHNCRSIIRFSGSVMQYLGQDGSMQIQMNLLISRLVLRIPTFSYGLKNFFIIPNGVIGILIGPCRWRWVHTNTYWFWQIERSPYRSRKVLKVTNGSLLIHTGPYGSEWIWILTDPFLSLLI